MAPSVTFRYLEALAPALRQPSLTLTQINPSVLRPMKRRIVPVAFWPAGEPAGEPDNGAGDDDHDDDDADDGRRNRPPFNGGWDPAGTANAILAMHLRPGMGAEVLETMRRNVRARRQWSSWCSKIFWELTLRNKSMRINIQGDPGHMAYIQVYMATVFFNNQNS
jgi:hypothetical protein